MPDAECREALAAPPPGNLLYRDKVAARRVKHLSMIMLNPRLKTPCVGLCSTVYGDLVCRGCKRFHHEVVDWNRYDEEAKGVVLDRLEALLVQVVQAKLEVFAPSRLLKQLQLRQIRFAEHQSPYCWAYQLLVRGARSINRLEAYGIELLPEFRDWELPALRDAIDQDFFLLSSAYYECCFAQAPDSAEMTCD